MIENSDPQTGVAVLEPLSGEIDRTMPTHRTDERPVGYHRWSDLLFVHWRVPAYELEDHIPSGLTIDEFDGSAWVAVVAFRMTGVRPWWSPPVPGISSFYETNVRTYVHFQGKDPGVYFISLDASSSLAVRIARLMWHLPYYRSAMHVRRLTGRVEYSSERLWPGVVGPGGHIQAEIGDLIGALDKNLPAGQAVPGTLEHFLAERYCFYTQSKHGQLFKGRVRHSPYPLREARLLEIDQTLLKAAKISPRGEPASVLFSEGVNVEVFKPRPVEV